MERFCAWAAGLWTICDPALKPHAQRAGALVVRVKPITKTKILVEWAEPTDHNSLLTVRVREMHSTDAVKHQPSRPSKRIVLRNLKPSTTYSIQLYNRDLRGVYFSDPMYATTWPSSDTWAYRKEYVLHLRGGNYFVRELMITGAQWSKPRLPSSSSSSSSSGSGKSSSKNKSNQANSSQSTDEGIGNSETEPLLGNQRDRVSDSRH